MEGLQRPDGGGQQRAGAPIRYGQRRDGGLKDTRATGMRWIRAAVVVAQPQH
jgi:hypothetical protein